MQRANTKVLSKEEFATLLKNDNNIFKNILNEPDKYMAIGSGVVNFSNDILNESMPPTTSYGLISTVLMNCYSTDDNYIKRAVGIKNER
jgi:hypothetical protein